MVYALNFLVLGGFSPLSIRSAPNDLPFAGHPYFGPNTLFQTLHELPPETMMRQAIAINNLLLVDIRVNSYLQRI
jgi:hypothetical protein